MEKKKLILIIAISIVILVVLGIIIGVAASSSKDSESNPNDDDVEIVNSYYNTEELIKKFPVQNPTTIQKGLEERIQNRLLTGFENWNRGFKAWKKWGSILYTQDSIYNVHGARLSLSQYQKAMDIILSQTTVLMGDFHNMLICGDFTAIFYDMKTKIGDMLIPGTVMEFVKFKEYGTILGTRVVEGWGSTKDYSYDSLTIYQGENEKKEQEEQNKYNLNYQIPDQKDLKLKYPVKYPSEYIDINIANQYIDIILKGFDEWNNGINYYIEWINEGYDKDAINYGLNGEKRTMTEYKEAMQKLSEETIIEKLYFDNILIRDNWAAIHYRYRSENKQTNEKYVGDRMQFLKFELKENGYKIVDSWIS